MEQPHEVMVTTTLLSQAYARGHCLAHSRSQQRPPRPSPPQIYPAASEKLPSLGERNLRCAHVQRRHHAHPGPTTGGGCGCHS